MVLGNASAIKVGTTSQSKIYIGTTQVWPAGGGGDTDYIYISPTSASISSAATSNTISVTASTGAWTVISNSSTYFPVSKTDYSSTGGTATWSALLNTGSSRSATFTFRAGTASTTFTVTQAAGVAQSLYLVGIYSNGDTSPLISDGESSQFHCPSYLAPSNCTGLTFEIYSSRGQIDQNLITIVPSGWNDVYYYSTDSYGTISGAYNYNFRGIPYNSSGGVFIVFSDGYDDIQLYVHR